MILYHYSKDHETSRYPSFLKLTLYVIVVESMGKSMVPTYTEKLHYRLNTISQKLEGAYKSRRGIQSQLASEL